MKETSQGWDHNVFVTLSLDTSLKSSGELVLQWSSKPDGKKRSLQLDSVSQVMVKKLNGKFIHCLEPLMCSCFNLKFIQYTFVNWHWSNY